MIKFESINNFLKLIGGKWKINEKKSANTSFPDFLKILKFLGATIN